MSPTINAPGDNSPAEIVSKTTVAKNTFSVSQSGDGDFTTINEAIAAALPGGTILIKRGTYEETLLITKPVTIEGENRNAVHIHHPKFAVIRIENTETVLKNLCLGIQYAAPSIVIERATVEILNCEVSVKHDYMMDLASINGEQPEEGNETQYLPMTRLDADPWQKTSQEWIGSVFFPSFKAGAESKLTVSDCTVRNAFIVTTQAVVKIERCKFYHCGIRIEERSAIEVFESHFHSNRFNAASFTCTGSSLMFGAVEFSDIYTAAIVCASGSVFATHCAIKGLYRSDETEARSSQGLSFYIPSATQRSDWYSFGVLILADANVILESTTVSCFRRGAYQSSHSGQFLIEDSKFLENLTAIESWESTGLRLTHSELSENQEHGLFLHGTTYDKQYLEVTSCKVKANKQRGIWAQALKGKISDTVFTENSENLCCPNAFLTSNVVDCAGVTIPKAATRFGRIKELLGWCD